MLNKKVLIWGGMLFAVMATASYVYGMRGRPISAADSQARVQEGKRIATETKTIIDKLNNAKNAAEAVDLLPAGAKIKSIIEMLQNTPNRNKITKLKTEITRTFNKLDGHIARLTGPQKEELAIKADSYTKIAELDASLKGLAQSIVDAIGAPGGAPKTDADRVQKVITHGDEIKKMLAKILKRINDANSMKAEISAILPTKDATEVAAFLDGTDRKGYKVFTDQIPTQTTLYSQYKHAFDELEKNKWQFTADVTYRTDIKTKLEAQAFAGLVAQLDRDSFADFDDDALEAHKKDAMNLKPKAGAGVSAKEEAFNAAKSEWNKVNPLIATINGKVRALAVGRQLNAAGKALTATGGASKHQGLNAGVAGAAKTDSVATSNGLKGRIESYLVELNDLNANFDHYCENIPGHGHVPYVANPNTIGKLADGAAKNTIYGQFARATEAKGLIDILSPKLSPTKIAANAPAKDVFTIDLPRDMNTYNNTKLGAEILALKSTADEDALLNKMTKLANDLTAHYTALNKPEFLKKAPGVADRRIIGKSRDAAGEDTIFGRWNEAGNKFAALNTLLTGGTLDDAKLSPGGTHTAEYAKARAYIAKYRALDTQVKLEAEIKNLKNDAEAKKLRGDLRDLAGDLDLSHGELSAAKYKKAAVVVALVTADDLMKFQNVLLSVKPVTGIKAINNTDGNNVYAFSLQPIINLINSGTKIGKDDIAAYFTFENTFNKKAHTLTQFKGQDNKIKDLTDTLKVSVRLGTKAVIDALINFSNDDIGTALKEKFQKLTDTLFNTTMLKEVNITTVDR